MVASASTAGEKAFESGPPSEPKHGRLRHVNSPQSRWADSRRDARPPGPIVIVQSYGAVWSTEKHNPKQDLQVCEDRRTIGRMEHTSTDRTAQETLSYEHTAAITEPQI